MRQIKFRVWDKRKNNWLDCRVEYNANSFFINDACTNTISWYRNEDDFVIQQFTGLLDKTGKEIYEGDILEGFDYPVEFWYGSFGARICYDLTFIPLEQCESTELLVLGNKFENKELLNNE